MHQDAYLRVAFTTVSMTLTFQVNEGKTTTNQLGQRLDRMDIVSALITHFNQRPCLRNMASLFMG